MKLFNGLRKRIVDKLIRPEDGYALQTTWGGEPMRFHYDNSNGKYYYSIIIDGQKRYTEATLMGWRVTEDVGDEIVEVDLCMWQEGILENIYEQYLDRLSKMAINEFGGLQRREEREDIVITKKSFCNIMNALDGYWSAVDDLEEVLNVQFENNMLTDIIDAIVETMEEELEPEFYSPYVDVDGKDPLIMRWLIEFDAGRDAKAKDGVDGHSLTTAEDLYDYLVRKKENFEKNLLTT